jgi:hypothetical protein
VMVKLNLKKKENLKVGTVLTKELGLKVSK